MKKKKRVYKAREGFTLSEVARVKIECIAGLKTYWWLVKSLYEVKKQKEGK